VTRLRESRVFRLGLPSLLLFLAGRSTGRRRGLAIGALVSLWASVYRRYRRDGQAQTQQELDHLRRATWEEYSRHYNERVPTVEEEFDIWGEYHQHRHEMRYDLVAAEVRRHLPDHGAVLDVGCGAGLVADRILDHPGHYVGVEFAHRNTEFAAKKFRDIDSTLRVSFARGDGEFLPFPDATFDVLVMSEVIEHLLRPDAVVWEVARVLKPNGVFVMTTNNASEVPLRSPLTHLLAWIEKALGATHPRLISLRPWVWPEPVLVDLLVPGSPPVFLPHTHHIYEETRRLFAAAGLDTFQWSTFEFPPPQSATAGWLERHGEAGRRTVDLIERAARRTPFVNRMGCHLFMVARRSGPPRTRRPPPGLWPGPFVAAQSGSGQSS
jgi:ubiquinone/menaquinone biosynthesis C-methylase UbiE